MSILKLILKSLKYYYKANIGIALGIAISTAVITGALIVGDSVSYSLSRATHYRLGDIETTLTAGDRFFNQDLSHRLSAETNKSYSSVLRLETIILNNGGKSRINRAQVWGIDSSFKSVIGSNFNFDSIGDNKVAISQNIADKLNIKIGDNILLKIKKASLIPLNAPFVSSEEQSVSKRVEIVGIVGKQDYGRINFSNSQTAPYNIFTSIAWLNKVMKIGNNANLIITNDSNLTNEDLKSAISLNDISIDIEEIANQLNITSDRIFFDSVSSNSIISAFPKSEAYLTYFVNEINLKDKSCPYSFVSTRTDLLDNEIIINSWLADDLKAKQGDTIDLKYFAVGPLRKLDTKNSTFIVKDIYDLDSNSQDYSLMPKFPGLSDAGNCRDWDTGIPIDLDKIRDKDEEYWESYKGSPKAFISKNKAIELWSNRFGSYTSFSIKSIDRDIVSKKLVKSIDPKKLGFQIIKVKEEGLFAATNGTDFSQLFIGLSFFIIVSGLLLTILLFQFSIDVRLTQIGTYSALGFSKSLIKKLFLAEYLIVAIVGSSIGVLLSIVYNSMVFYGLNRVWQDIVRTNVLEVDINASTLFLGFFISLIISGLTIAQSLNRRLKQHSNQLQKKVNVGPKKWVKLVKLFFMIALASFAVVIIVSQLYNGNYSSESTFFMAGSALLVSFILLMDRLLTSSKSKNTSSFNLKKLIWKNMTSNKSRSMMVIILLSIGSFLVISTGANRQDLFTKSYEKTSGTGGFNYFAKTTMPILKDLSDTKVKSDYGINDSISIIQFRSIQGDDASCLNLNRISRPQLLGVDADNMDERFSFVTKSALLDENNPWSSLNSNITGLIPAIADQTVILWSLGKKVGDTLIYTNEFGEPINLILVGGLGASVFQGNVLISNENFLKHFPSSSGSNIFLVEGQNNEIEIEFNLAFKDLGWEMEETAMRLANFKSVENTYLSIFLVLGAFGLLLGIIGIAIVLARSINERKSELSLLFATGYSQIMIYKLIFREYLNLLLLGIFGGSITALIAVFPALMKNQDIPLGFISVIILTLVLNGIIWIGLIGFINIKRSKPIEGLRND